MSAKMIKTPNESGSTWTVKRTGTRQRTTTLGQEAPDKKREQCASKCASIGDGRPMPRSVTVRCTTRCTGSINRQREWPNTSGARNISLVSRCEGSGVFRSFLGYNTGCRGKQWLTGIASLDPLRRIARCILFRYHLGDSRHWCSRAIDSFCVIIGS